MKGNNMVEKKKGKIRKCVREKSLNSEILKRKGLRKSKMDGKKRGMNEEGIEVKKRRQKERKVKRPFWTVQLQEK